MAESRTRNRPERPSERFGGAQALAWRELAAVEASAGEWRQARFLFDASFGGIDDGQGLSRPTKRLLDLFLAMEREPGSGVVAAGERL